MEGYVSIKKGKSSLRVKETSFFSINPLSFGENALPIFLISRQTCENSTLNMYGTCFLGTQLGVCLDA